MGATARSGPTPGALPRRWAHVQGVAARARSLAPVLGADADLLEAAAWLHDVGYAPRSGRHGPAPTRRRPVSARHPARRQHAYHSCAIIEASERGLAEVL